MNNDKWKKGIEDLNKISLSEKEKGALLKRILTRSPYNPILSPQTNNWSFFARHYTAFVSLLLIFTIAGSISASADSSLPGNILYPVKIKITEPIRELIKINQEDKTKWQIEKASRRIEEAEILATQNKLDDKKREEIQDLFEKSVLEFDDSIKKFEATSTKEKIEKMESELEKRISVHSKVVTEVNKDSDNEDDNELEIFEKNIKSVINKNTKNKDLEKSNTTEIEKYKKDVEKMVEKRLKELEKEREKIEKKYRDTRKGEGENDRD